MLSEPLSVTYDGTSKSLPRVAARNRSVFRTGDGEFEVSISNSPVQRDGSQRVDISLSRKLPDPTPGDAFDAYRTIRNSFGISYVFDTTRAGVTSDIPLLRTALLNFVDATIQSRIIAGER